MASVQGSGKGLLRPQVAVGVVQGGGLLQLLLLLLLASITLTEVSHEDRRPTTTLRWLRVSLSEWVGGLGEDFGFIDACDELHVTVFSSAATRSGVLAAAL